MTDPVVRIRDLRFGYPGGFALQVAALDIGPGERVALIGPSGCGKTTLLGLIAGMALAPRGEVLLGGVPLAGVAEAARRALRARLVGQIFQDFQLVAYLSVVQNILYPYRLTPALVLDGAARARAVALATGLGLAGRLGQKPGALSQGERQRVTICRALVTRPALILADEPTGNLDGQAARRVIDLILDQAAARGAAVLVVTHDHGLLDRFDRVVDVADFQRSAAAPNRTGISTGPGPGAGP